MGSMQKKGRRWFSFGSGGQLANADADFSEWGVTEEGKIMAPRARRRQINLEHKQARRAREEGRHR